MATVVTQGGIGPVSLPGSVLSGMASSTTPLNAPPTPPITTSNSPTASSTTPTSIPTPSPSFSFSNPANFTSCEAGVIGWSYAGPAEQVTLFVLDAVVLETGTTDLNQSVATNIQATDLVYVWTSVNVAAGEYVLAAEGAGVSAESARFFVVEGSDTSCLGSTAAPTVSAIPVSGLSSSSSSNHVGAIVGGVIGGVAGLIALLLALFFICRRRRLGPLLPRTRALSDTGARKEAPWNGLSSRDTVNVEVPAKYSHDTESHSGHSQETAVERYSVDNIAEDKLGSPFKRELVEMVPPLSHTESRRSSVVTPASPSSPVRRSGSYGRGRARSQSQAVALVSLDSSADRDRASRHVSRRSVDVSYLAHSPSAPAGSPVELPSPLETAHVNRSSSAGVVRRTTRKPVPTYLGDVTAESDVAHVSSGVWDNADIRTHSREDLAVAAVHLPRLDHKSSFGEMKPMHVLIPDMPPPQRD